MSSATPDWDARTYHRVSTPHQDRAAVLLDRLALRGDETVLDAGCGSGRVTEKLVARVPRGRVVAVDGAPSMVAEARALLGDREPYAHHLGGYRGEGTWRFATAEETAERLTRAGFTDVRTWLLQPWDVTPPEPAAFVKSVCLHPHAERLPDELVDLYISDVLAEAGEPLVLDYVRLNLEARRPA